MKLHWNIWQILYNPIAVAALSAQVSSQVLKVFQPLVKGKPPDFKKFTHYGGIPSAHTAFLIAATIAIGLNIGWNSPLFAFAGVISAILIYDILKLRTALERSIEMGRRTCEYCGIEFKQRIPQFQGHSAVEVITGAVWGILWALFISLIWAKAR